MLKKLPQGSSYIKFKGGSLMNKQNRDIDVFEIDLDEALLEAKKGFSLEDIIYLNDLKERKLVINEDINQYSVSDAIANILKFNKQDKGKPVEERQPILLTITSNGGSVTAGFELIDIIQNSKTPVYTINIGWQYSMGFLIGLAGHKRYCSPNATFLMHDGSTVVWDSGAKAQDQMEFNKRTEERIKKYIISRSKLTEEEYDSKLRVEWYLFADEAKEKGFTDFIIGEDVDIDVII